MLLVREWMIEVPAWVHLCDKEMGVTNYVIFVLTPNIKMYSAKSVGLSLWILFNGKGLRKIYTVIVNSINCLHFLKRPVSLSKIPTWNTDLFYFETYSGQNYNQYLNVHI